jgi:hypothetical protein
MKTLKKVSGNATFCNKLYEIRLRLNDLFLFSGGKRESKTKAKTTSKVYNHCAG